MTKIKDGSYITIQSFMVKELNLKGNDLLVYAIIFGFSQDGETYFDGSLQYIADWTNSTRQGISKTLKGLVDKGLIEKKDTYINGVKFCSYRATQFNGVYNSVAGGVQLSLTGGVQQSLTNNISKDIIKNTLIDKESDTVLPNNTAKKKLPKSTIFEDYAKDNSKLLEALQNFDKDRKERKQPMTERAKQLFVNKLESLSSNPDEQTEIINQSIENGWKSIYPLKGQLQQNKPERNYNYGYGQEGVDYL